eukprot:3964289-Pleurochrysis_carterae.AAC.4
MPNLLRAAAELWLHRSSAHGCPPVTIAALGHRTSFTNSADLLGDDVTYCVMMKLYGQVHVG